MDILAMAKRLGGAVRKNSPLLLTIGTVAGIGVVIFTTSKATLKTKADLDALKETGEDVTKKDIAKVIAKDCWPVAVSTGTTVAMTVANHKITADRIKTATAAYEFTREAYDTYKSKVREKLGENADREVETEIVKDKVNDISPDQISDLGYGNVLFIESVTGQVFRTSVDYIRKCEKQFNVELKGSDWCSFNNWLRLLGLRSMDDSVGDYLGFSERFEHDGLNVVLTASNEVFGTGETATVLSYEDPLCTEGDYRVIDW